jgi:membrane-bound serine protease (ClpP class)
VQAFLDSDDLPIVVYVAPEGASAASAGTFITMASHIAAMAPATNIGAASPVQIGPGGATSQPDTVMQKKIFNYSESYIQTIAERRGRNAEWAISAVRDGESITADEALEINVIDLIANDRKELLDKINGRTVAGNTLQTNNAEIIEIPTNLAENFLGFIIRPEVILILTMIAIYGIIGEVTNPGAIIPGVAGVIALILILYASAAMPLNTAGFALIGLAIVLFIAEAFTPAFGLLIAAGSVSFFLGALFVFQDLPESMSLSWGWLVPATLLTTLFFAWIVFYGIKIQFTESTTGKESMIGKRAEVTDTINPKEGGRIFINGEYWNAVSEHIIKEGTECEITEIAGLTMRVQPAPNDKNIT